MTPNPFLGVCLHLLGGVAAGSFYVPFRWIRHWSWESYWLIMNLLAYLIMPWVVAWLTVPRLLDVFAASPKESLLLVYGFGVLWGIGGLAFGLTLRYLGMSLGMSLSLGLCATFGTLGPPLYHGTFDQLLTTFSGCTVLAGVVVCLAGIVICGWAGIRKERELTEVQKAEGVKEFDLVRGFIMAVIAGVMSASMAFGIDAGKPIGHAAMLLHVPAIYQNNPVLVLVMGGNFTANLVLCLLLNLRNGSVGDYFGGCLTLAPLLGNYVFAGLAGIIAYTEFFWYGMGTTKMGRYDFSSWSIHLAFVIIVSNLWGIFLKEWKGVRPRTWLFIWGGTGILLGSTIVIGAGNYLAKSSSGF